MTDLYTARPKIKVEKQESILANIRRDYEEVGSEDLCIATTTSRRHRLLHGPKCEEDERRSEPLDFEEDTNPDFYPTTAASSARFAAPFLTYFIRVARLAGVTPSSLLA
jgi:hypothetical protein